MKTKLTEMFGIEYPIVQSGMQWLAVPQLAAAVCNAGGIGTINVTCWPTLDEFADALDEMNSLTNKPYIVNISLAPTQRLDNEEIRKTIRLCGEKHVAAIETSAEDPREFIADIKSAGMRHFHKCPNYKVSMSMERKGLDGVIIAGYEVGGHPSADGVGTFVIARRCAADMKIPVIAAGGIADGRGVAAAFMLGACGVQMGTRFLSAEECSIHPVYKERILKANDLCTMVTGKRLGHPVRSLRTNFARNYAKAEYGGMDDEALEALGSGALRKAVVEGDLEEGCFLSGQVAAMVNKIQPAAEIVREVIEGAEPVLKGATQWVK